MPGAATAIRQERLKKTSARTNPPGLFTINEEDEQQKNGNAKRLKEHPPVLKVDDRQRLARIRREELEKQLAARESLWLEKEERARQHYEKHLEERKKKLEEQRLKEEKRRAAVEEKRKQRIEEDKERHEAVVRRTIERSQKPKQMQNRWSWGGPIHRSSSINNTDPDRRSVSTMNLWKHVDPVINKRLSSSSATLLNSPDRARRPNLSPLEKSIVSRLLMPTHSFLARSKSTAALSGDAVIPICPRSASCSPISPLSYKAMNCRNPADRPKFFDTTTGRRRTTHSPDKKEKDLSSSVKRLHSPSNPKTRSLAHASKSLPFLPGTPKQITSPPGSSKVPSSQTRPPSPGNIRPIKKELKPDSQKKGPEKEPEKAAEEQTEEGKAISASAGESAGEGLSVKLEPAQVAAPALPPAPPATSPSPVSSKASAGTTDPEEATRLLTEKRRLAREQREREEQERKEREETESPYFCSFLITQKEEAARQSEEAERIRLEREKRAQREEQERLERKKRLEEIMRRTRRTEAVDKVYATFHHSYKHLVSALDQLCPSTLITYIISKVFIYIFSSSNLNSGKEPNENGVSMQNDNFEEIINLPIGSKPSTLDALNNDGSNSPEIPLNPILAFEDKGTLGSLPQVDSVQTPQTAEVI
uniref:Microtubule associated protein 7 n=1 Tax=Chelonoidis abingdonii TaxID=106734 RepID=A0A8C0GWR3_CHEAB